MQIIANLLSRALKSFVNKTDLQIYVLDILLYIIRYSDKTGMLPDSYMLATIRLPYRSFARSYQHHLPSRLQQKERSAFSTH